MGRALRVGQLPLEGLAQRQADRQEPRRLPALRDPPAGRAAQARRRQPPGHPRRLAPQADRLPALGPVDRGQADRRLVELRRPAARGLPAQDQRRRLQHGRRAARPAVRDLRRRRSTYRVDAAQLRHAPPRRVRVSARFGSRTVRRSARAAIGAKRFATLDQADQGRQAAPVVAREPVPLRRVDGRALGRRPAAALHAEDRRALDQGRRRPPVPQRRADELPRRRRCTRTRARWASRSTTRPATSSSRGSRSSARRSSARTTRCARTRRSARTSWGSCSGRRSRSTRSRRSTSSRSSCASSRPASSSRTSRPTATTRR